MLDDQPCKYKSAFHPIAATPCESRLPVMIQYISELVDGLLSMQIKIKDVDHYLAREKGTRKLAMGKNQSLFHYIGQLNKEAATIFHTKYIENSNVPLMAIKALSNFVVSQPIKKGMDKIILVEKK